MVLSDRDTLKIRFQRGRHLSNEDFSTLIDSMLNKRADQFHGTWQLGRTYCNGDVVLHCTKKDENGKAVIQSCNLWMMKAETCICADQEPSHDSQHWMPFPDDGDWVALADEGAMWAKVYDRVGIGIGSEGGDRPQARLDVRKINPPASQAASGNAAVTTSTPEAAPPTKAAGQGRWLLFPQEATHTQTTLLHYAGSIQSADAADQKTVGTHQPQQVSYLVTGLSQQHVTWCSDASQGFSFRKGQQITQESDALRLAPSNGTEMMVLQPRAIGDPARELACLGLNASTPAALLDITDPQRGRLLFLPHSSLDPTLCLRRRQTEAETPYTSVRVGVDATGLFSNAAQGFRVYQGNASAEDPAPIGDVLLQLRQSSTLHRPQLGIGTTTPAARLDIACKDDRTQVQILPEQPGGAAMPAIALFQQHDTGEPTFLTAAVSDSVSGWVSNARQGFVFRQVAGTATTEQTAALLEQGQTHLAIRESGYVGIGTEAPSTRLEITSHAGIGTVLFELDQQSHPAIAIRNREPEQNFTLGTGTTQAVLLTDTPGGFQFKAPLPAGTIADGQTAHPLDITAGRVLVNISPEGNGRVGIGCAPRDYAIDVQGIVQAKGVYQDTNADQVQNVKRLTSVLSKLQLLRPILFEWRDPENPAPDLESPASASPPSDSPPSDSSEPGSSEPGSSEPSPANSEPEATSPNPDPAASPASTPLELSASASPPPAMPESATPEGSSPARLNPTQQFGLLAHEVDRVFPEAVRTASDGSQSVAYTSLVPVLIQALNDLNRQHQLDKRRLETLAEQLANRIAVLAIALAVSWAIALLGYLF
jgi:hypothetical protein